MTVYWRGEPVEPTKRDMSCSLCGFKDYRYCGCPWDQGFADVPAHWVGNSKRVDQPGWDEELLRFVRVVAPCPGPNGWKPPRKPK